MELSRRHNTAKQKSINMFAKSLFAVAFGIVAIFGATSQAQDAGRPVAFASVSQLDQYVDGDATVDAQLTQRYASSRVRNYFDALSASEALSLFQDVTQLIDNRHLKPTTYVERTDKSLENLMHAVENGAFLEANGIQPSAASVDEFQRVMAMIRADNRTRTVQDATNLLWWTMNTAWQQLKLKPSLVAAEFIFGATGSLDKYSSLIVPTQIGGPSAAVEDHVVGIGVSIESDDEGLRVLGVLRGGSAEQGGLKAGDLIVTINGQPLKGWSLDRAADMITGPEGTTVRLGVVREGRMLPSMTLVRRYVAIQSVSDFRMIDASAKVGYIKLERFAESTMKEVDEALWALHRSGMQSLVFDVRGNPGGLLTTAIDLSNKFLPCGSIVSTRGRNAQDNSQEAATFTQTWKVPLVVLVDGNSASASEIFAAAIQENRRGLIVGRKSYGKGTVQTQFTLGVGGAGLRLTTAKFYSPEGREMAGSGVTPDILVPESITKQYGFDNADIVKAIEVARGANLLEMSVTAAKCRLRQPSVSGIWSPV